MRRGRGIYEAPARTGSEGVCHPSTFSLSDTAHETLQSHEIEPRPDRCYCYPRITHIIATIAHLDPLISLS